MSIIGSNAIRHFLKSGVIVCDPAPERIEGTHIDVRLGVHYWRPQGISNSIDLKDADPLDIYCHREGIDEVWLLPQCVTLCHTEEFIGTTVPWLLPVLHTRSTLARWGLSVHMSAGLGDCGWTSRWTLEVFNPHPVSVIIPVGARVGAITFERVEDNEQMYREGYNVGRAEWQPSDMLPRKGNW